MCVYIYIYISFLSVCGLVYFSCGLCLKFRKIEKLNLHCASVVFSEQCGVTPKLLVFRAVICFKTAKIANTNKFKKKFKNKFRQGI